VNLLDTHIIVWWLQERDRLTPSQDGELQKVSGDRPVAISSISLWELSMLHLKGRLKLHLTLLEFLSGLESSALVRVLPINAAVATAVSMLPRSFHQDPADRILRKETVLWLPASNPIGQPGWVDLQRFRQVSDKANRAVSAVPFEYPVDRLPGHMAVLG
jgi:PIN domain nuclease of toxin-antitoxin system